MSEQILLFSGGIDSYIAWHFLDKPKTVYFDLGTPYSDYEVRVVKELIPDTIIDRSLNLGSRQVPDSVAAHVPMRNLYLAMLACHYGDEIIICGLKDDNISDKTPEAFKEMSTLLSTLNDRKLSDPIKVTSPFWNMTKADIVKWYLDKYYQDPTALLRTISCYTPSKQVGTYKHLKKRYCGICRCCFRKWNSLYANGVKLPFYNLALMKEYLYKAQHKEYDIDRCTSIITSIVEFARESKAKHLGKIYRVDIDGVLTNEIDGHNYESRTPNADNIKRINRFFQDGARIVLWTSRYLEDEEVTKNWLSKHNVMYDELILGKPQYDRIIDDKCWELNDDVQFKEIE